MNLFKYLSYREILLEAIVRERSLKSAKLTFAEIARACGLQNTYFSNVLRERADLSADQAFVLARYLRLSAVERDYLIVVLEWERSGVPTRKSFLREKIDRMRKKNLATQKFIDAEPVKINLENDARYFLDPLTVLVHTFLRIPRFARDPARIAEALSLGEVQLAQTLRTLQELGHIQTQGGGFVASKGIKQHLSDESVFCVPHQNLFRLQCIQHLQRHSTTSKKTTLVTFSADAETRVKIEAEISEFIRRCQKWVAQAPGEYVYQLNLDFFPWNPERA